MTDLDVLEKCFTIFKIGKIYGPYKRKNPKWKDAYDWTISKRKEFLELSHAILPFLCSRRTCKLKSVLEELKDANNEMYK